eukprot:6195818-Pleurochrysis_carterae.AAC.1
MLYEFSERCRDELPATIFQKISEAAARYSVAEAYRERLSSDPLELGLSQRGKLTSLGCRVSALDVGLFERVESHLETLVRARCSLCGVQLFWSFASDEVSETATFSISSAVGFAPPRHLMKIRASGKRLQQSLVEIDHERVSSLAEDHIGCGMDAMRLCHLLLAYLPEFLDEGWDMHERLVRACESPAPRPALWAERCWWRRRSSMGALAHVKRR